MIRLLYRIYQFVFVLPIGLTITAVCSLLIAVFATLGFASFAATWFGGFWAWSIIRLCLLPVRVEGREHIQPGQSYVFMANHQGAFDIFLVYGFLHHEFKWMMKKSLFAIPLVGTACRKAGFISVDNSSRRAIVETMIEAKQRLTGGASLCVFPEGTRTFSGKMGTFKSGGFQLASHLKLPILPMTIDGSFEVLPRNKGFNFVEYHPLRLVIHPPLQPASKGTEQQVMNDCRRIIESALPPQHRTSL